MNRYAFLIVATLLLSSSALAETADSVLVDKSDEKLYLLKDGSVIAEYSVAFGATQKVNMFLITRRRTAPSTVLYISPTQTTQISKQQRPEVSLPVV